MADTPVKRWRVWVVTGLVGLLSVGVISGANQFRTSAERAEKRADPNRWACIVVVRGYGYADERGEFDAIASTAASLATDPRVKRAVLAYPAAADRGGKGDPRALETFKGGCNEYLPFDKFDD